MQDGGTTILRGAVPSKAIKDRAVLLARDTVGVTRVVDELTVLPPARVIPAPSPTVPPGGTTTIIKSTQVIPTPTATTTRTTTVISKP